ncbi:MAG: hypothetical protein M4579_003193 [Chaenotheca gracillima]|nr:MAG: hypothetical protein M4579_003193 [Chaenotheca gracillima]
MGQYRIEISANNRATCKNKDCKDQAIKITKGEPRLGTFVEINGNQSWAWKHWGCVTPAQITNIQDSIDGDIDMLDGYDEMPEELQGKIQRAIDEGHVDDSDWKGDPEFNRPGMKGMHKRTPKKKKAENEDDDEPAETNQTKASGTKRDRTKKDDQEEDVEPAPKKSKTSATRGKKAAKPESDVSKESVAKTKTESKKDKTSITKQQQPTSDPTSKTTAGKGKRSAVKEEVVAEPSAKKEKTTKKRQPKKDVSPGDSEDEVIAPKKTRKAPTKGTKEDVSESEDAMVEEPPRKKQQRGSRKSKVDVETAPPEAAVKEDVAPKRKSAKAKAEEKGTEPAINGKAKASGGRKTRAKATGK